MENDTIWKAFESTGAPLLYLLYRHNRAAPGICVKKEIGEGENPAPAD